MRTKYRLGVHWEFIVWSKALDEPDEWHQTGLWSMSITEALERVLKRPLATFIKDIREVEPWYWVVYTENQVGVYSYIVIVRRADCPDPDNMPLEPIDEPQPVDPSFKRLPSLQL